MKLSKLVTGLVVGIMFASSAFASVITYETRKTNNGVNQADYQASWGNQTSSINTYNLNNFTNQRAPGGHFHSYLSVSFDASATNSWGFQLAPDAGFGGALYVNGTQVDTNSSDLWWGFNWNNTNELLGSTGLSLNDGTNTIEAYWAEACCNGGQSARFSADNGQTWKDLSTANLSVDAPEPGVLALLGLGLLGTARLRRQS